MERTFGAVYRYLAERFGGPCRAIKTTYTIGTSTTQVTLLDPDRIFLMMVNLGTDAIYVLPGSNPSSSNGFRLDSLGGFASFNLRDDFILPTEEWNAIGAVAALPLLVIQVRVETMRQAELPPLMDMEPVALRPEVPTSTQGPNRLPSGFPPPRERLERDTSKGERPEKQKPKPINS